MMCLENVLILVGTNCFLWVCNCTCRSTGCTGNCNHGSNTALFLSLVGCINCLQNVFKKTQRASFHWCCSSWTRIESKTMCWQCKLILEPREKGRCTEFFFEQSGQSLTGWGWGGWLSNLYYYKIIKSKGWMCKSWVQKSVALPGPEHETLVSNENFY